MRKHDGATCQILHWPAFQREGEMGELRSLICTSEFYDGSGGQDILTICFAQIGGILRRSLLNIPSDWDFLFEEPISILPPVRKEPDVNYPHGGTSGEGILNPSSKPFCSKGMIAPLEVMNITK